MFIYGEVTSRYNLLKSTVSTYLIQYAAFISNFNKRPKEKYGRMLNATYTVPYVP